MKKTIIALFALSSVAMGGDWAYQSTGAINGATDTTAQGTYRGITFTLVDESDRAAWVTAEDTKLSEIASITLTSIAVGSPSDKNGADVFSYSVTENEETVSRRYSMILVDDAGKLVAVSTDSTTSLTKPIDTIDYTRKYGTFTFDNVKIEAETQYFAYFVTQENLKTITEQENFTLTSANFNSFTTGISLFAYKGSNATDFSYKSDEEHNAFSHDYLGEKDIAWIPAVKIEGSYMVPEPTTATLSLLALAGLAARRRRK